MENGLSNGHLSPEPPSGPHRFLDIPRAVDIPVSGGEGEEAVEVDLEDLLDDPTELCTLLENENVAKTYWMMIAMAYAKQNKIDTALELVNRGLRTLERGKSEDKLGFYNCLCWLFLLKSREAPRVKLDGKGPGEIKTKEFYLRAATTALNDASRISPSFPPLSLVRGVLCLLRAALLQDQREKSETYRQAIKFFDNALRSSKGQNMMASLGRAKAMYSLGRFPDALKNYQEVLERSPDITDPDPRIGIGCCFWQLGYKDDAKQAWIRSLELNPDSKIANILLGIYHLNSTAHLSTSDPQFASRYKKAMVEYTQRAFKLDNELPLACATFGSYFLVRKAYPTVELLARKAIELTDVNAVASDGWYLLARKEHYSDDPSKATDYYLRADQARGGDERGYLPAKFGVAQLKVIQGDRDGAKFRLEKMIQQSKSLEAMVLLGTLFAEDAFAGSASTSKDEQSNAARKAISLLEAVRLAWKDPKKTIQPETAVLINLARLYETDNPEKALQCLAQAEQLEITDLAEDGIEIEALDSESLNQLREQLSPQLLNNIACFHFQFERFTMAREIFQTALTACVKLGEKESASDTDGIVTSVSYNLARTYEAEGLLDEARKVYEGLLERHSEYTDARSRLAYIALRQSPQEEGPKAMAALYEAESTNMEVRALQGWYLKRAKRRTNDLNADQEQRLYKHTLQNFDKYDRYSLTGMGNLFLATAREMRKESEQEKEKRRKMYERAIEIFDKALQLDAKNAYAAQGIGIAIAEDKKDFAAALQIFSKVKETIKDPSVYVNLGHVYTEVKQFARAIESYEIALSKDRAQDPQILACLGRAWLMRGRAERSVNAMKNSLDYSQRALEVAPEQIHFKFNLAFVQIQIAQLLYSLPDSQRTLQEVEEAASGLEQAIDAFSGIAKAPNPPFPRHDIEQRANMGRNTMRKQLERAVQSQRDYEEKNKERLQKAREAREAEIARREEERRKVEEEAEERRRQIAEERQKMQERDAELARRREEEEERTREEERRKGEDDVSVDEETGEKRRKPRKKGGERRKRKKKEDEIDSDLDAQMDEEQEAAKRAQRSDADTGLSDADAQAPRPKKKRRKLKRSSKYKSNDFIDSEEDLPPIGDDEAEASTSINGPTNNYSSDVEQDKATTGDEEEVHTAPRKKPNRVIDDDDDDEDDSGGGDGVHGAAAVRRENRDHGLDGSDVAMEDGT